VSTNLLLLMHPAFEARAAETAQALGGFGAVHGVRDQAALLDAVAGAHWDVLLSFGTGVIVPASVLAAPGLHAYNIHAAPPRYPGRDPHHFAAYEAAAEYGATLHLMTASVDQGPIVATDIAPVAPRTPPQELLAAGNAAGLRLLRRLLAALAGGARPAADPALRWTGPVRRRRDFIALCRVDAAMAAGEFERRLHACAMPGYANLWTEVHGRRFVLDAGGR
jgi:methionyl-tRNA formyltransferase